MRREQFPLQRQPRSPSPVEPAATRESEVRESERSVDPSSVRMVLPNPSHNEIGTEGNEPTVSL